jgi:hypothetical protein
LLRRYNFKLLLLILPELLFHGHISDNDCDRHVKFSIFLFLFLLELFRNLICKFNGFCDCYDDGDDNLIFFYFYFCFCVYDKLFINFVDFYGFWNIYEDDLQRLIARIVGVIFCENNCIFLCFLILLWGK